MNLQNLSRKDLQSEIHAMQQRLSHLESAALPESEGSTAFKHELSRLAQLNLVGELAASIGHEVRNPLTTVRGFLQLLSDKDECRSFHSYFTLMIEELDRANTIISEFLSLARNNEIITEKQDLNQIISLLAPLIHSDAIMQDKFLQLELEPDLPELLLHGREIRQLILNLARNGLEAMTSHGTLSIRTWLDKQTPVLSISDQGSGIPDSLLEKLGTPFFTTKEKGTGLGLAVCYNIAAKHKAHLKVETSSDGTTFHLRFNQQTAAVL